MPKQYTTRPRTCHAENSAWREGMQRVNDESGGMLAVDIVDERYGAGLLARAMLGDRQALVLNPGRGASRSTRHTGTPRQSAQNSLLN
jgi:hypothetical protein